MNFFGTGGGFVPLSEQQPFVPLTGPGALSAPMTLDPQPLGASLGARPSVYDPPVGKPLPTLPGQGHQPQGPLGGLPGRLSANDDDEATEDERPPSAAPSVGGGRPPLPVLPAAPAPAPAAASSAPPSRGPSPKPSSGGGSGRAKKVGGTRTSGGINLRVLIDEGYLQPGSGVLSVEYKGSRAVGDLTEEGRIVAVINGQTITFESPSAFSIYLKRLVNPSRKADDGWKTVKYKGVLLEQYKLQLSRRRTGEGWTGPTPSETGGMKRGGSASALSGMSVGGGANQLVSAEVADGDRNVVRLKFARPKKEVAGSGAADDGGAADGGARKRPRRAVKRPPRFAGLGGRAFSGADDEHALQPLEAYVPGPPGAPGAQPFAVRVSPAVELLMDFHAHLSRHEVIGILAGTYDAASRSISVLRALPVRELATEDDSVNVEMDPEDEFRARDSVSSSGLRVPSRIDVYNQALQQHHHRGEGGEEPFVAAIVGPYDRRSAAPASSLSWFYVDHPQARGCARCGRVPEAGQDPAEVGCLPKQLRTEVLPLDEATSAEVAGMPQGQMQQLGRQYAPLPHAADLGGQWREGTSRGSKLAASLTARLLPAMGEQAAKELGAKAFEAVMPIWHACFGQTAGKAGLAAAANEETDLSEEPLSE
eukprot:scaffold25.g5114.t1